ncbi:MAG: ATPase domain, partial [Miltoncostaeaceae bacterium]|nr:ATPase domain [Miltoncostaeaceae bacterium]
MLQGRRPEIIPGFTPRPNGRARLGAGAEEMPATKQTPACLFRAPRVQIPRLRASRPSPAPWNLPADVYRHSEEDPLPLREAERAALERLAAGAAEGRAGALVVAGEAGIGKSALLEQLARTIT